MWHDIYKCEVLCEVVTFSEENVQCGHVSNIGLVHPQLERELLSSTEITVIYILWMERQQ